MIEKTMGTVVVLAKEPSPGRVKTRLGPHFTADEAALLAAAALSDTLDVVDRSPAARRVLAFDGRPGAWLRGGWVLTRQPGGQLDQRLVVAFQSAGPGACLLVGMDTPQMRSEQLAAFDPTRYDACIGLAHDGGYWAIGFADPGLAGAAIRGIPMSTAETGARQLDRLWQLGARVQLLDELTDVDTAEDVAEVASLAPDSWFARTAAALRPALVFQAV